MGWGIWNHCRNCSWFCVQGSPLTVIRGPLVATGSKMGQPPASLCLSPRLSLWPTYLPSKGSQSKSWEALDGPTEESSLWDLPALPFQRICDHRAQCSHFTPPSPLTFPFSFLYQRTVSPRTSARPTVSRRWWPRSASSLNGRPRTSSSVLRRRSFRPARTLPGSTPAAVRWGSV